LQIETGILEILPAAGNQFWALEFENYPRKSVAVIKNGFVPHANMPKTVKALGIQLF
jgi:hypothetical protein